MPPLPLNDFTTNQLIVALAIPAMCGTVVAMVYWWAIGRTPEDKRHLVSKSVFPLITVGCVVCVVYALAVLGILKENTVSALLGGVAGYILGSGKMPARQGEE